MSRIAVGSSVFAAIADPTRRAILDLLREGEQTVNSMLAAVAARLGRITQSAFSQHLAVLRRAGLVSVRREGRSRVYSFRAEPLEEVVDWIVAYDRFWTEKLDNLGRYLDTRHAPSRRGRPRGGNR